MTNKHHPALNIYWKMVLRHWCVLWNKTIILLIHIYLQVFKVWQIEPFIGNPVYLIVNQNTEKKNKRPTNESELDYSSQFYSRKIAATSKMSPKQSYQKKSEQVASTFRLQPLYVTCNHEYALFIILVSLFFQLLSLMMNPC